jgi:hypothetical protein
MIVTEEVNGQPRESVLEIVKKEMLVTNQQVQELSNAIKALSLQVSNVSSKPKNSRRPANKQQAENASTSTSHQTRPHTPRRRRSGRSAIILKICI